MHTFKIFLVILLPLFVIGCIVTSLHPLFTENDEIIFDEALVGTWLEERSDFDLWSFEKSGEENEYNLFTTQEGKPGEFHAFLGKIEDKMFLNIYPKESENKNKNWFYYAHLKPTWSFLRIYIEKDTLRLILLDYEWFKEMANQNNIKVKYEREGDSFVLTAPTEELQQFILKYADNEDAFSDTLIMYRKK